MIITLHEDVTLNADVAFEPGDEIKLNGYRIYITGTVTWPPCGLEPAALMFTDGNEDE